MERPKKRPEGALLEALRERAGGLTVRGAAKRVSISEARWRQIENGYQVPTKGVYLPVIAPPETLAEMVRALGGTPIDLRNVGRLDASEALMRMGERQIPLEELLSRASDFDLAVELARRLAPAASRVDVVWPNQDEPIQVDPDAASPFDRPPAPNDFFGRRRTTPEQPDPETEASQQAPGDGGYWLADKQLPDDLPEAAAEGHGGDEDPVRRAKRELDEAGEESQDDGGVE